MSHGPYFMEESFVNTDFTLWKLLYYFYYFAENQLDQSRFLNLGSRFLLLTLTMLVVINWQLPLLQGLKTSLDFTYLGLSHHHLPQRLLQQ